jgi:hypothetical protein
VPGDDEMTKDEGRNDSVQPGPKHQHALWDPKASQYLGGGDGSNCIIKTAQELLDCMAQGLADAHPSIGQAGKATYMHTTNYYGFVASLQTF